jgi:hypothetical protein
MASFSNVGNEQQTVEENEQAVRPRDEITDMIRQCVREEIEIQRNGISCDMKICKYIW